MKARIWWHRLVIPELGSQTEECPWDLLFSQPSLIGEFPATERQKNKVAGIVL